MRSYLIGYSTTKELMAELRLVMIGGVLVLDPVAINTT